MVQERTLSSFDNTQLYLKVNLPEPCRAIAVVVHGLCEHQGRYDYLVARLNENGIGAYRFDHRGHGRSEGERTYYRDFQDMIEDLNAVVETAQKEHPALPIFLVGHSMGGFCVSLYGAKYPDKVRGIVLSGALTHDNIGLIAGVPQGMDPHTKLPNELGDGVCSVKSVVEDYLIDPYNTMTFTAGLCYELTRGVTWLSEEIAAFEYPALILHGERDALVGVQDSYDFFGKIASTDRQMKVYGGLYHEIFNEYCRDEVIGDAIRWITNRIE